MVNFPKGVVLFALCVAFSCSGDTGDEPFVDHEEASDLIPMDDNGRADGVGAVFNRNNIVTDELFTAASMIDAAGLQTFFENPPYNGGARTWLADYMVGGVPASQAIAEASLAEGINPLIMVARMQVEKSLISRNGMPSGRTIDAAFGCGCPDGRSCLAEYRGLDRQISCAAQVLRRHFDGSQSTRSAWRVGVRGTSLDGLSVTPANHATASLYSYTPWVLEGRGGNWLVWNVTKKFVAHMTNLGVLDLTGVGDPDPIDPDPIDPDPWGECTVNGVEGECIDFNTCPVYTHTSTAGFCPGGNNIQCCTPVMCQVGDREGQCSELSSCDTSTHEAVAGYCPGPSSYQCCLPLAHTTDCGDDNAEGESGNDTAAQASELRTYLGQSLAICEGDDDYFHVDLWAGDRTVIAVRFTTAEVDIDVALQCPNGDVLRQSTSTDHEFLIMDPVQDNGQYILHVFAYSGQGSYYLELTENP